MIKPIKAPERAKQRVTIQESLGSHPRHVHPRSRRLQGSALRRAIYERDQTLDTQSLELEKRQMAEGSVLRPSLEGASWLWGEIMNAMGFARNA